MRLWQLNFCVILLIGILFIGARLIAPAPAKKWSHCVNPTSDLDRALCAEYR